MKTNFRANVDMIFVKIIVVAVLAIVMLLPINLVKSLIEEREENQQAVTKEISEKWGGKQILTGPVLVLPYETGELDKSQNPILDQLYLLPDDYNVDGEIVKQDRSRTLYQALVYQTSLKISGRFSLSDSSKLQINKDRIKWQEAFILIGVPYMQGIKNKLEFLVNNKPQKAYPNIKPNNIIASGLTIDMPIDLSVLEYNFNFDLMLNGSEGLYLSPIGKESRIHLHSDWNTVSFDGDFLPSERLVNADGFDAKWDVFDYNRNYIQAWAGSNQTLNASTLGVVLKYPVEKYQMTMRSVKYAIMFIALTFVVFFLVEILSKKKIHPVQYLLVSCALLLFYTLLLAISEHISFGLAYLISALATTALITAYSSTIFKNVKQTSMMGLFLFLLYSYLYIILQQENLSLLFGAVGLFIALAVVMFVLRKIDWYKNDDDKELDTNNIHSPKDDVK